MAKYILLYKGPATPMDQMTREQVKAQMDLWQAWMGRIGNALIDMGQPMAKGQAINEDGSVGPSSNYNGYSLIEAGSLDEATKLVDGHPFLSAKTGQFSVEVYELVPMPSS